tara:strand:- start:2454 stop:3239 length:786 start_codon:yes stop_codon:yes gene_type:complete
MAGNIDPIQGAQAAAQIDMLRDQAINQLQNDPNIPTDELRSLATKTVTTLVDVINGTMVAGEFDMAASMNMDDGMSAIAAIRAAQADSLEGVFRELVTVAKEQDPEFPPVNLDALKHAGATFHTLSIPVPPFDPQAQAIFGEAVDISIGMSADHIYFGFGKGNLNKLKAAIDASAANKGAKAEPMKMEMAMSKILIFAAEQGQNPMLQQAAAATGSKDKARMLLIPIENGGKFRIELESGVLKAISVGAQALQPQLDESPF